MNTEVKEDVTIARPHRGKVAEIGRPPLPMVHALEEVERLVDRLMARSWMTPLGWRWPLWNGFEEALEGVRTPRLDIIDRDQDMLIHVEMPGIERKDIEVSLLNSTLQIRSLLQHTDREHRPNYYRSEIVQGNFSRTLALPPGVDSSRISATLKDGILEIVLPKEPQARRRSVEIR